ncbi:hypothetical protein BRADI_5g18605v3 [Brachypodium distachyon]|uniref:Uncharacterized protein n=1 Tax=Brachypodium distachyon TaxID=15368 RepID=A0A2K2CI15_BRADI|nr:hypothetical protein BRADI_5g18605v3 [Brachypodium distachyon]
MLVVYLSVHAIVLRNKVVGMQIGVCASVRLYKYFLCDLRMSSERDSRQMCSFQALTISGVIGPYLHAFVLISTYMMIHLLSPEIDW